MPHQAPYGKQTRLSDRRDSIQPWRVARVLSLPLTTWSLRDVALEDLFCTASYGEVQIHDTSPETLVL